MREHVAVLFAPDNTLGAAPVSDSTIGAELELIPIRATDKRRVPIHADTFGVGTADVVRAAMLMQQGGVHRWRETTDAYGAPSWQGTDGGAISYEPGGQLEISSPVYESTGALLHFLRGVVEALRAAAEARGVELLAVGVDPYNTIDDVPVQLHAPRYDMMARHFERVGPAGVRMMRQTASLQINVELGPRPLERWRLLNALAPYLTAAFSNSRMYAGHDTGHASHRAVIWQALDPTRTGLPYDANDPVAGYTRFAERATRILSDDAAHLTTLFPEVRPRGYFELRSIDALELDRAQQAIELVAALTQSDTAARDAMALVGEPDASLLHIAATEGRDNHIINARIIELQRIANVARR